LFFRMPGCIIIKPQSILSGYLGREAGTMSTKRKRPAKKGAPKRKKRAPKKKSAMSAVELRALQAVLASREFRADTSWPKKEDVEGWDRTAFDVPGNFEAFCIKYEIWPWNRGPHARPFQCVRCEPKNEPTYYKDADGHTKVAQRRNDYYLAQECR
jgi:hypothetical protein